LLSCGLYCHKAKRLMTLVKVTYSTFMTLNFDIWLSKWPCYLVTVCKTWGNGIASCICHQNFVSCSVDWQLQLLVSVDRTCLLSVWDEHESENELLCRNASDHSCQLTETTTVVQPILSLSWLQITVCVVHAMISQAIWLVCVCVPLSYLRVITHVDFKSLKLKLKHKDSVNTSDGQM